MGRTTWTRFIVSGVRALFEISCGSSCGEPVGEDSDRHENGYAGESGVPVPRRCVQGDGEGGQAVPEEEEREDGM